MDVKVTFVTHEGGPERLLADAELYFPDGPLAGMKMVGFSLWQSPDGEVYVTFPSRSFGSSTERRYFEYLRSGNTDDPGAGPRRVKEWIKDAFDAYRKEAR